jgi:hypothetical protein
MAEASLPISSFTFVIASVKAAIIKSCSISTSVMASGVMRIPISSSFPLMSISTRPPPEAPVAVILPSFS